MTDEELRKIDALVAEHVTGVSKFSVQLYDKVCYVTRTVTLKTEFQYPPYSTDIKAAWEVVERLKMYEPELSWSDEQHVWCLYLNKASPGIIWPTSESAPLAICLAALKAKGI